MENYLHRVLGLYENRADADSTLDRLLEAGLPRAQLRMFEHGDAIDGLEGRADSDDVLKDVLRDGALGTALGTVAGAAGTVALVAANISLFIASPVLGPLVMLGWGASLGGVAGAVVGAERSKGDMSELIQDAQANGHIALVANTSSEDQTSLARRIIGAAMNRDATVAPV